MKHKYERKGRHAFAFLLPILATLPFSFASAIAVGDTVVVPDGSRTRGRVLVIGQEHSLVQVFIGDEPMNTIVSSTASVYVPVIFVFALLCTHV